MNIAYLVSREWSLNILKDLIEHNSDKWDISMIVTTEDFDKLKEDEFKNIEVIRIKPKEIGKYKDKFIENNIDLVLCYGWSWIIPDDILENHKCVILHPSKLPKYRGGSPIQNQLIDGITQSAITLLYADKKLDAGRIILQKDISFEGYLDEILRRITSEGIKLSIKMLNQMVEKEIKGEKQDETEATTYKRRTPEMSEITIEEIKNKTAKEIYNKVRGLQNPYPLAFIKCKDGTKLYITRSHI